MELIKILLFKLSLFVISTCFSQNETKSEIKLVNSNALNCDNTYDPYRIKNRITHIEKSEDLTKITVNFSDNCCSSFEPTISYKNNKLFLIPYTKISDIYCSCDCCFSIEYEIVGLKEKNFEIFFKDKKVEYSENYYDTISPSFELYKGEKINQIDKYGFNFGKWMTFYEDSSIKSIYEYPETVLYFVAYPKWTKHFHQNGSLKRYTRNDTIQQWFDDGTLQYENYEYTIGDTLFEYTFSLNENRHLEEKSLYQKYPVIHKSKYNNCYEAKGSKFHFKYKETFYENGQRKHFIGSDSSTKWYPNGQIEEIITDSKSFKYDSLGRIIEKKYFWDEPGNKCSEDLKNSLSINYNIDFNIVEISLIRDEAKVTSIVNRSYIWQWNTEGVLIKSPENWNEELPWKRFKEIKIKTKN